MGNFSKDPQSELAAALDRDYFRVRFQQGKPALDRELNLAADLAGPQRLAARYLGSGIAGTGTDFSISGLNVAANDFAILAGRCLVNGLEAVLRANTSYRTQPNQGNVTPLPAGSSNVYLRVFEREVSAAEDPLLANAGDVTFETAVRSKVDWQVVVSAAAISRADHFLLAVITTAPAGIVDRRRLNLSLADVGSEVAGARGNTAALNDRLNAAHAPNGTLLPNSVASAQIAALAVTQDKIATNSVTLTQLKQVERFNGALTLQPNADGVVTAFSGSRHARLLISVTVASATGAVSWTEFVNRSLALPQGSLRGVRVRNESSTPITVDVEIHELLPA